MVRLNPLTLLAIVSLVVPFFAMAAQTATTTLTLSICGNSLVDNGEECDIPGETGVYSQTIVGRQCSTQCQYGPYCGDGILQSPFGEQCDDGNNTDGDFCSSICKVEPAGSGGGGSSGGGSSSGGGTKPIGDTQVSVSGLGYPGQTINFLLDTKSIGTVKANAQGRFEFATAASPGTATLGVWALDYSSKRSITLNSTFDVTQGAVTNVRGLILPPTLSVANPTVIPGTPIAITGQGIPVAKIEIHFNKSEIVESTTSGTDGKFTLSLDSSKLRNAEYSIKARSITGTAPLLTPSSFSSSVQLFVGVDGVPTTPSDLNRDAKIDLIDFSILIFWWQTAGGDSNPPADISGNGKVSLEDFSILLFNWTG